jgi:hypothetical protein
MNSDCFLKLHKLVNFYDEQLSNEFSVLEELISFVSLLGSTALLLGFGLPFTFPNPIRSQ